MEARVEKIYSSGNTYVNIPEMNFEAKKLPYTVYYLYNEDIPKEKPTNYVGIFPHVLNVNQASCPDNPFNSGGNGGTGGPIEWVDVIGSVETVQDSIEDVIDDRTDGGTDNDVITKLQM